MQESNRGLGGRGEAIPQPSRTPPSCLASQLQKFTEAFRTIAFRYASLSAPNVNFHPLRSKKSLGRPCKGPTEALDVYTVEQSRRTRYIPTGTTRYASQKSLIVMPCCACFVVPMHIQQRYKDTHKHIKSSNATWEYGVHTVSEHLMLIAVLE